MFSIWQKDVSGSERLYSIAQRALLLEMLLARLWPATGALGPEGGQAPHLGVLGGERCGTCYEEPKGNACGPAVRGLQRGK